MRTRNDGDRLVAAAALLGVLLPALLGASCATNPTPPAQRRTPEVALTSGYGGYAFVELERGRPITGELIAAQRDKLIILNDKRRLGTVDFAQVRKLTVGVHDNYVAAAAMWVILGTLSTISHGVLLVITAPLWVGSGISATADESRRGLFICEPRAPADLSRCLAAAAIFARFPQGLPPGVGEAQLLGRAPAPVAATPAAAPALPAVSPADPSALADGGQPSDARPIDFPTPYDPGP